MGGHRARSEGRLVVGGLGLGLGLGRGRPAAAPPAAHLLGGGRRARGNTTSSAALHPLRKMGIDLVAGGRKKNDSGRKAPKSKNVYLLLLVKVRLPPLLVSQAIVFCCGFNLTSA